MTLETLLHRISEFGISNRIVNWSGAGASIYELANSTIKDYPVLFTSPTGTHTSTENTTTYNITMYFIDRLVSDNSNDIEIFSTAIEALKNIIKGISLMDGIVDVDDTLSFTNFTETERFPDRCAGAFCTFKITVLNASTCYTE